MIEHENQQGAAVLNNDFGSYHRLGANRNRLSRSTWSESLCLLRRTPWWRFVCYHVACFRYRFSRLKILASYMIAETDILSYFSGFKDWKTVIRIEAPSRCVKWFGGLLVVESMMFIPCHRWRVRTPGEGLCRNIFYLSVRANVNPSSRVGVRWSRINVLPAKRGSLKK